MPNRGKVLQGEKLKEIDLALLRQKETGETYEDLEARLQVPVRTLARRRSQLVKTGVLAPKLKEPTTEPPLRQESATTRAPDALESILEKASSGNIIGAEESMRILSIILADPNIPSHYRVQASKHLNDLRTQHAPKDALGPPPPMTDAERLERITALMDCVGESICRRAMETLWSSQPSSGSVEASSSPSPPAVPSCSGLSPDPPTSDPPGDPCPK